LNYTRIHHTSAPYQQRLYIIALLRKIVKHFSPVFSKKFKIFFYFFSSLKNGIVSFCKYLLFYCILTKNVI